MEQELSIKEILWYCLRRWYIFVLGAVVCGVVGVALYYTNDYGKQVARYEAGAAICKLEAFAPQSEFTEQELIRASWEEQTARAVNALWFEHNTRNFTEVPANAALVKTLSKSATHQVEFLAKRLTFNGKSYQIIVGYETSDPKEKADDIKALLDAYVAYIRGCALDDAKVLAQMGTDEAIAVFEARYIGATPVKKSSLTQSVLPWVLGGIAAAAAMALLLYFVFDPRLKGANEVERRGFKVEAKLADREFLAEELAGLIVALDEAKRICVANPDGADAELGSFCSSLSAAAAAVGNRVLWIDGSGANNTAGKFAEYLFGAPLERCVSKRDGFDVTAFTQKGDFLSFSPKSERIRALTEQYDKVIISVDAKLSGAVTATCGVSDAAVCVLNRQKAKSANLKRLGREVGERITKAVAVLYGCKE
ncbi:MAG: hypothetical protein FWD58_01645 [Firmicutes bacterium]|nr:hypothetical protein [Bacillota bacterium]